MVNFCNLTDLLQRADQTGETDRFTFLCPWFLVLELQYPVLHILIGFHVLQHYLGILCHILYHFPWYMTSLLCFCCGTWLLLLLFCVTYNEQWHSRWDYDGVAQHSGTSLQFGLQALGSQHWASVKCGAQWLRGQLYYTAYIKMSTTVL